MYHCFGGKKSPFLELDTKLYHETKVKACEEQIFGLLISDAKDGDDISSET